jgi:hypothetical protein
MLQVVALSEHLYILQGSLRPLCLAAVKSAGQRLTVLRQALVLPVSSSCKAY